MASAGQNAFAGTHHDFQRPFEPVLRFHEFTRDEELGASRQGLDSTMKNLIYMAPFPLDGLLTGCAYSFVSLVGKVPDASRDSSLGRKPLE